MAVRRAECGAPTDSVYRQARATFGGGMLTHCAWSGARSQTEGGRREQGWIRGDYTPRFAARNEQPLTPRFVGPFFGRGMCISHRHALNPGCLSQ